MIYKIRIERNKFNILKREIGHTKTLNHFNIPLNARKLNLLHCIFLEEA